MNATRRRGRSRKTARRSVRSCLAAGAAILLLAGAARAQRGPAPGSAPPPDALAALLPDTTFTADGRPRLVVLRAPGSPVASLRASVRVDESAPEAGAARMMADLAVARARSFAGPVAPRIEAHRTSTGIAYAVTGAAGDFDYLAYLLRILVSEPQPNRVEFQRARSQLLDQARRDGESPSWRIVRELRARAFPGAPPLAGDVGSLTGMTPEALRSVWARTHGTGSLTVVVVGDLPPELILASLQGMGHGGPAGGERASGSAPPSPSADAQILRRWYGEARVLPDAEDPRGEVAALLVSAHMRRATQDFESHVQLWEVAGRRALAVYGASYRARQERVRTRVGSALREAADGLTEEAVAAAVARVRKELLYDARTPWGRAAVVERHLGPDGDARGAHRYAEGLDRIDTASMRAYLQQLAALTPVRAEVTP